MDYDAILMGIMEILTNFYIRKFPNKIVIPKLPAGYLDHSADLILINGKGVVTEFVVRTSVLDFKMDFINEKFIDADEKVSFIVYVVPEGIYKECKTLMKENTQGVTFNGKPYSILSIDEKYQIEKKDWQKMPTSKSQNPNRRPLTKDEYLGIARYGCACYFNKIKNIKKIF